MKMLFSVWKKLIALTRLYPVIVVPFIIAAVIDAVVLIVLFLAPRPPLSMVIAPVIRAFWGEQYVHYPFNFFILPELFNYARTALSFFTGVILTAVCMAFIAQSYDGTKPQWGFGIRKAVQRYIRLFIVWGIILAVILVSLKIAGSFVPTGLSGARAFLMQFIVSIFFQTLFIFAIPSIIIENRKVFPSIGRSLNLCRRHPLASLLIVGVPGLLFIPLTYVDSRLSVLIERTAPDIVLYTLFGRIIVIGIIDFVVSSSAAVMLLICKEKENSGGARS